MKHPRHTQLLACVLVSIPFALGACGSESGTGPAAKERLDATPLVRQAEQMADIMATSAIKTLGLPVGFYAPATTMSLTSPQDGVALARERAAWAETPGEAWWIPTQLRGKTFVNDDGAYSWDPARTDAPSDGVRLVLYERIINGRVLGPSELGVLDLVDRSSGTTKVGQATIYDAGGIQVGAFEWSIAASGGSNPDHTYLVNGTLGASGKQVVFTDTSALLQQSKNGMSIAAHVNADFADLRLHLAHESGGGWTSLRPMSYTLRIASAKNTIRLEAAATDGLAPAAGITGTLYLNDALVANLDFSKGLVCRDASGGPAPWDVQSYCDAITDVRRALPLATYIPEHFERMISKELPRIP